jgi:hypothetical protein
MALDPARRSALLGLKLGTLVRDHAGEGSVVSGTMPGGAALVRDGEAWVLAEDAPARSLGGALAWMRQQGASALHVLAEAETGLLARRASAFSVPVSVWQVSGRSLSPAVPSPPAVAPPPDPAAAGLVDLIIEGGAEPIVEHGVLAGEVLGLEVCRAVVDPLTGAARLEVGVGQADREAFQLLHGDVPPVEALREIVERVSRHRQVGAEPHPLNRLAGERLLRARLASTPSLVGATSLRPGQPPVPRPNLRDPVPCVAAGEDVDGRPLLVVCSVGVDLDLVPYAADARLTDGRAEVRLVLAVPERDASPVTQALAGMLREPAELVPVPFTR